MDINLGHILALLRKKLKLTNALVIVCVFIFQFNEVSAQGNHSVSGIVVDNSNQPIIGATVLISQNAKGTITNVDGEFTLNDVSPSSTLKVSYVGYKTQIVQINGHKNIKVVLLEEQNYLDEVVVVGYGKTTRRHIISSVATVDQKAIEDRPVANITQALQGAAANLIIQQTSFNPNDNAINLNIRGLSTMGNNSPLVVIDGVTSNSGMNDLNPSDIENISILKDAGSAAIYGSRGANGVILITTKQGHKDMRPIIKFSAQTGIEDPHVLAKEVHGYQNAILNNEALYNVGSAPKFTMDEIQALYDNGDCKPFVDQILKNGFQKNYNINIQGGTDKTTYLISAGYYNQRSNYVGPNYGVERYNFRTNLTTQVGNLKLTANMSYIMENNKTHTGDNGFLMVDCTRVPLYYYYKMKSDDGSLYYTNDILGEGNPLGTLEAAGYKKEDNDYFSGNYSADYKIFEGLNLRAVIGGESRFDHRFERHLPVYYATSNGNTYSTEATVLGGGKTRESSDYNGKTTFLNAQLMLDFERTFGKHNVSALFGYSNESNIYKGTNVTKQYLNDLGVPGDGTVIVVDGTDLSPESTSKNSIKSFFSRLAYSYNDRYYCEFDMRYDESSKFYKKNRNGFFPSASIGWRASEENFMKNYRSNIGDLKLRASYGVLGNQYNVGNYDWQTTYTMYSNSYSFNGVGVSGTGFTLGNTGLTWERAKTFNLGVDATFFKNTLTLNADYFYKRTTDILLSPNVPGTFGGGLANENRGIMDNQGWELTINYYLNKAGWKHHFSFNMADSKNKVKKYGDRNINISDSNVGYIIQEGQPFNSYFGYKTDGYFKSYEDIKNSAIPLNVSSSDLRPGDVKYKDIHKDGVIDEKDRTILGYAFPRYTFGFNYNVSWKGFDFGVMMQGVLKRKSAVRGELIEPFHQNYSYTMYTHQLDYWKPENTDSRWPRLAAPGSSSDTNNYGMPSSIFLLNGAYLRVKDIQLGYTFPKDLVAKFGCKNLRVYVNAQNAFTFTKNSFVDPESSEFGTDMGHSGANSARNYPTLIYYGAGIDLTF